MSTPRGKLVSAWKCCGERTCQREQPIRVIRSVQDGQWYAVTAYAERAAGVIEPQQKHRVHPADAEQLEHAHQAALLRNAGKRDIVDVQLPTGRPEDTITPANAGDTTYQVHPEEAGPLIRPKVTTLGARTGRLDPDDTGELVVCRHCGQELHQGRGNMLRGPDDKSVCAAFDHPGGLFHEPVRPPS